MKCGKCSFRNTPGAKFCAQCGTGLDLFDTPTENIRSAIREIERGTYLFGRYEVIEQIGSGGMGAVYKVFDKTINEMVALKIIRPEIATDKTVIERFGQELKTARKISHRHVCRMFDIGEEAGVHYITMEYIPGEDLRSLIKRIGQLTVAKTIHIARQICEGLAEAHAMGVVHRDLKPQNIMIDREGNAKIMDFGIARFVRAKGLTTTGTIIGTPEYMSPEQAEGKGIDQRSDIYSLGIVLFEALTGQVPFEGGTPLSVAMKHKMEPPPDPRKLNIQIPGDLGNLILKCLGKEPEQRYQTVSEIISDLDLIERGISTRKKVGAERKPRTDRTGVATSGMKKALVPGGVILALAALAFGIWYFGLRPKPPGPIVVKPDTLVNAETPDAKLDVPHVDEGKQSVENAVKEKPFVPAPVRQDKAALRRKADSLKAEKKPPVEQVKPNEENTTEGRIQAGLAAALRAYDKKNYQECLDQSQGVLRIDPKNTRARNYANLAATKLTEAEINPLIDQYVRSLKNNPAEFYKTHCEPQLYEGIRKGVEQLSIVYENFKPSDSNRNIRLTGSDRVEATFSQRLMGTRKGTTVEQDVWSGTMQWNLERQQGNWRITNIVFQPLK
jgi:serine/threonine protein kinase